MPEPWLASLMGQEPRVGPKCHRRSGISGLEQAPEPQAEVVVESGLARFLLRGCAQAYPMGIAPKPLGMRLGGMI